MDRNNGVPYSAAIRLASLSARRAWIEMHVRGYSQCTYWVALRKESVDRNLVAPVLAIGGSVALRKESVDRNPNAVVHVGMIAVALRKESVDRNLNFPNSIRRLLSRSPQGERG